jgi:heme exporter protein D
MQQWQSLAQFIHMDGYGLYIWGAYGVTLVCMLLEPWLVGRRRQQAWRDAVDNKEDAQ